MDNNALLLLAGAKKIKQTIGVAGQQGFGVGVYGGDSSDLTTMGLAPMSGCHNPSSDNYGNYIHTNGSIMCFVPAFCYRIGNPAAPSYARDKENALEIRDASKGEGDGWILHRAFIDGGVQKTGFFMDKYLCSKSTTDQNVAVSVKNADQISLSSLYENSSSMSGCHGKLLDAITLGRARGAHYSCVTAFQWAAMSMLSLAHAQASKSSQWCAWYDASGVTNYPKGCNTESHSDTDETSLTWAQHSKYSKLGKTGSCSTFAKSTHNGQSNGIADVNGCMHQPLIGWNNPQNQTIWVMKESFAAHDMTEDNYKERGNYDVGTATIDTSGVGRFWGANAFYSEATGVSRALCGVIMKTPQRNSTDTFGRDYCRFQPYHGAALAGGGYYAQSEGFGAGVWFRINFSLWLYSDRNEYGFRAAGYAQ